MSQITDIKEQINDLTTFKRIAGAFTEASSAKLANIRKAFARNERFFNEITHIYHLVKTNAYKANTSQNPIGEKFIETKKLTVALTSNQRFFGTLNNAIMQRFVFFSEKNKTERLVIGGTGTSYMRGSNYKEKYQNIIFATDSPTPEETSDFMEKISKFQEVTIFFPKFISIIRQEIGSIDITGKLSEKSSDAPKNADTDMEMNILFEPELSKILKFFETEVRTLLFKRVLLETELARTAARLLEMSQAEERTEFEVRLKMSELRKVKSSITNAQLLETFSGIKKWKHSISDRRSLVEMKNKLLFK